MPHKQHLYLKAVSEVPPRPAFDFTRKGMEGLRKWNEKRKALKAAEAEQRKEQKAINDLSKGSRRKARKLHVYGRLVDPEIPEAKLLRVKWVKDVGVTARGKGDDRRLVAFVVLEAGRLIGDVEDELREALSKIPAYYRPQAYSQVAKLPRDPVLGHLKRYNLSKGSFDGRIFNNMSGIHRGRPKPITAVIRNPLNEVRFEGVVACPPESRRDGDGPGKLRQNEARLKLSHREPNQKRGMSCTFLFRGEIAKAVRKLEVGTRVAVYGRITTESNARQFLGVSFDVVDIAVERVDIRATDSVIEALL